MRILFISVIFCLSLLKLQAQDVIAEKMRINGLANPPAKLFVHFDKNVYSSNEMAWFTAYLLEEQVELVDKHTVLAVSLVRDADSTIVVQEKFVMGQGLAFGNMVIPNKLENGEYHFMVFTNVVVGDKPTVVFTQRITLKTKITPALKANIAFQKKPAITDQEANLLFKVSTSEDKLLPKAAEVTYQLGNFKGKGKTDTFGQLAIAIPFAAVKTDTIVSIKVKYEKDSALVNIAMPVFKRNTKVSFYPEGGYLVNGIPGYVSFEIKDQFGQPIQTQAVLMKDNVPTDTLQSNYYGMGRFALVPETGANYAVTILSKEFAESTHLLPQIIENGISISVNQAVVTDTLNLTVRGNLTGNYNLRLHNFRESYTSTSIYVNKIQRLKIPLAHLPKGLFTITISDSLNRPVAERMAFAHYDNKEKLIIETDKQVYQTREKVILTLALDKSISEGVFSVAVVQAGRINYKNKTDIESYAYLNSELGTLPISSSGNAYKDIGFLEDVLRIKGWNRYSWLQVEQVKAGDTLRSYDTMEIAGAVTRNGKPLAKATSLGITVDSTFTLVQTDLMGTFTLPQESLIAESGKKAFAFLNGLDKNEYKISVSDPFANTAHKNVPKHWPSQTGVAYANTNTAASITAGTLKLNEVVVRGNKEKAIYGVIGSPGPNACGDYVCFNNVLNCLIHSSGAGSTSPIVGQTYPTPNRFGKKGASIVYQGCYILKVQKTTPNNFLNYLPVIYTKKEFYGLDLLQKDEQELLTTLFWKHAQYLNQKDQKSVKLEFYTGDIKGDFKIVIQGVNDYDLTSHEMFVKVN